MFGRPLRAWALGLVALALAWHGAGAPLELGDACCSCEEADALEVATDGRSAHVNPRLGDPRLGDQRLGDERLGDERLGDERLGEDGTDADEGHETCPPGCDHCSCCGGSAMVASAPLAFVAPVPVRPLVVPGAALRDAPRGEPSDVFRPPRG